MAGNNISSFAMRSVLKKASLTARHETIGSLHGKVRAWVYGVVSSVMNFRKEAAYDKLLNAVVGLLIMNSKLQTELDEANAKLVNLHQVLMENIEEAR